MRKVSWREFVTPPLKLCFGRRLAERNKNRVVHVSEEEKNNKWARYHYKCFRSSLLYILSICFKTESYIYSILVLNSLILRFRFFKSSFHYCSDYLNFLELCRLWSVDHWNEHTCVWATLYKMILKLRLIEEQIGKA